MIAKHGAGRTAIAGAAALLVVGLSVADRARAQDDISPAAGLPLEEQVALCGSCHGETGNSELPETPSLAGQPALFITTQMIYFRERLRRSEIMTPQARGLKDPEIEALAAYYAKAPVEPAEDALEALDDALMARGRDLARAGRCGVCHLPDYSGRQQIPRLSGQREDFLVMTMIEYREQVRGGPDTTMVDIMRGIPDEDVRALAHFVARAGR